MNGNPLNNQPQIPEDMAPFHRPAMVTMGLLGGFIGKTVHDEIEAYAERHHLELEDINCKLIEYKKEPHRCSIEITRKQGEIPILGYPIRRLELTVEVQSR